MDQRRDELQALFLTLVPNVYFQPPESVQMNYPCIIYKRDDVKTEFANNSPYKHMTRYQATYVDTDPDGDIRSKLAELPLCSYERFYTADDLNHDVYNLFF